MADGPTHNVPETLRELEERVYPGGMTEYDQPGPLAFEGRGVHDVGSLYDVGITTLGVVEQVPTDEEIGAGNIAVYALDGAIHVRPHGGSAEQVITDANELNVPVASQNDTVTVPDNPEVIPIYFDTENGQLLAPNLDETL